MSADRGTLPPSDDELTKRSVGRFQEKVDADAELTRHRPSSEAMGKIHRATSTLEGFATACEVYADRPCFGERAFEVALPPGREGPLRHSPGFVTIRYGELWSRVAALASGVVHQRLARTGDFVGVFGFGSVDWMVANLACRFISTTSVLLQSNSPTADLRHIANETGIVSLVCSASLLDAVEALLPGCPTIKSLVVMDHGKEAPDTREALVARWRGLQREGLSVRMMNEVEALGRERGLVPMVPPSRGDDPDPPVTLFHTSGSTGRPKSMLLREDLFWGQWVRPYAESSAYGLSGFSIVQLCHTPLNHGRGWREVNYSMIKGGVTYFVTKTDMSTLMDDIRLVRPTVIWTVPRIAGMFHQRLVAELAKRGVASPDDPAVDRGTLDLVRDAVFGDRVVWLNLGAASAPPEVVAFVRRCLDAPIVDVYGTMEASIIARAGKIERKYVTDFKLVDRPELGYTKADEPYPRGELYVKSRSTISGYYMDEGATKELISDDGFMITGDIVELRAPEVIAWVDRAKNVLKLSQGEFVAVSQLEALFSTRTPYIQQVYVYGNAHRAYVLAVIVPDLAAAQAHLRERGVSFDDAALKQLLRDEINRIAKEEKLRGHENPRDFLVEREPFTRENRLLTESAKPARPRLKALYGVRLEGLYAAIERAQHAGLSAAAAAGASIADVVTSALQMTLGLTEGALARSFIDLGGDSMGAVELTTALSAACNVDVPIGLVLDRTSTVGAIVSYVEGALAEKAGNRPSFERVHGRTADVLRADDLTVAKLLGTSDFASAARAALTGNAKVALLTGANGFLGRFLVLELLARLPAPGGKLYCVVRAPSDAVASERLRETLIAQDPALAERFAALSANGRLVVLAGDLMKPRLGLSQEVYGRLCEEVDCVVHNGALVNHALSYRQLFEPNVLGTADVISLALTHRVKPISFISSIAVALGLGHEAAVREEASARTLSRARPAMGGHASGYGLSKWAGELLLEDAEEHFGLPVRVFRCGNIMTHTRYHGQVNASDHLTRLLCGIVATGVAPASFYVDGRTPRPAHYDGLPVDAVSRAIAASSVELGRAAGEARYATYHLVNHHTEDGIGLDTFVEWARAAGYDIGKIGDYAEWYTTFVERLVALPEPVKRRSPLQIVQSLQRPAIRGGELRFDNERLRARLRARGAADDAIELRSVDEALMQKYFRDMVALGLIDPPQRTRSG